jgi:hypothetical protein
MMTLFHAAIIGYFTLTQSIAVLIDDSPLGTENQPFTAARRSYTVVPVGTRAEVVVVVVRLRVLYYYTVAPEYCRE